MHRHHRLQSTCRAVNAARKTGLQAARSLGTVGPSAEQPVSTWATPIFWSAGGLRDTVSVTMTTKSVSTFSSIYGSTISRSLAAKPKTFPMAANASKELPRCNERALRRRRS